MLTKSMAPKLTVNQITQIMKLYKAGYHFAEIINCVGLEDSDREQLAQIKKHLRNIKKC